MYALHEEPMADEPAQRLLSRGMKSLQQDGQQTGRPCHFDRKLQMDGDPDWKGLESGVGFCFARRFSPQSQHRYPLVERDLGPRHLAAEGLCT
jgi:hypothetical protein